MLKVDGSLDHIPARRGHVVSLHESINQPLVNIPGYGAAPTGAFILGTRNDHGAFTVFVYLYQPQTQAVLIYVSEPRSLTHEQLQQEETEAVRFVESMGFMVDDVQFSQLAVREQESVIDRVPMFRPLMPAKGVVTGRPTSDVRFGVLGGVVTGRPEPGGSRPESSAAASPLPSGLSSSGRPSVSGSRPGFAAFGAHGPRGRDSEVRMGPTSSDLGSVVEMDSSLPEPWQRSHDGSSRPGQPIAPADRSPAPVASSPSRVEGRGPPLEGGIQSLGRGLPAMGGQASRPPGTTSSASNLAAGASLSVPPPGQGSAGSAPSAGAAPAAGSHVSADTMARIGRLLGTFGVLLMLGSWPPGCATTPSKVEERARQAEIDLGHRELARGQWADALRHFERVLEADDNNGAGHRGAGLAYWRLNRLDKAEAHLRDAVASDDKWSEPKNDLAVVLIDRGECEEARGLLAAVLDDVFYPTHHFAEHNLARAEACAGLVDEAVARLQRLTLARPKFCLAYLTASEVAERNALHEATVQACEDFREHCEQDSEIGKRIPTELRATCDLRKGLAYAALGDVESARTALTRCGVAESTGRACREALVGLPP